VITRPGSPQAWRSTAVIMLEKRMGATYRVATRGAIGGSVSLADDR
jgi:hypothetical protein